MGKGAQKGYVNRRVGNRVYFESGFKSGPGRREGLADKKVGREVGEQREGVQEARYSFKAARAVNGSAHSPDCVLFQVLLDKTPALFKV